MRWKRIFCGLRRKKYLRPGIHVHSIFVTKQRWSDLGKFRRTKINEKIRERLRRGNQATNDRSNTPENCTPIEIKRRFVISPNEYIKGFSGEWLKWGKWLILICHILKSLTRSWETVQCCQNEETQNKRNEKAHDDRRSWELHVQPARHFNCKTLHLFKPAVFVNKFVAW